MRAEARAHGWVALLAAVLLSTGCVTLDEAASAEPVPQQPPSCGGQAVPAGWPDFSSHDSQALLAPFLTCSSPAEYVALQEHVDMPRLVESLTDWDAVRLGSLGPVREDAAGLLNRKRLAFLLRATDRYGVAHAEVFVRFLLDSAYDEELRELLFWLARDKRLETTLGRMPRARAALDARGLKLSARADRDFQPGDLLRGAGRAVTDLLTHEQQKNAWYTHYARQRGQLPPSYQQDLDEVEWEAARQHYSPGNKARPLMSKARPGATGAPLERQGTLASLVDEGVGHTPTVVEAKLAAAEQEATGPRLPMDVRVLRQHRPALDTPPPEARIEASDRAPLPRGLRQAPR